MSEIISWLVILFVVGGAGFWTWYACRPRRITDTQLGQWFDYLSKKPQTGTSKAFRATTAKLSEDSYDQIKLLYPPKLLAEWEERFNKLRNEFAIRALENELESRRVIKKIESAEQTPIHSPLSEEK